MPQHYLYYAHPRGDYRPLGSQVTLSLERLLHVNALQVWPIEFERGKCTMAGAARKIVVVDNNHDLLYTIRVFFEAHGHAIWTEDEMQSGVRRIASERPDIAYIDLNLPRMDGYRLARMVRRDDELALLRLIAITTDPDPACFRRARAAGFETTLIKPVPLDEMLRLAENRPAFSDQNFSLRCSLATQATYSQPG